MVDGKAALASHQLLPILAKAVFPERYEIKGGGHHQLHRLVAVGRLDLTTQGLLLVTNDGGPGQFAALTPIWTLMLFGPETPSLYAPVTPKCYSFYSQWPCSPCLTAYNHRSSYCDGDNQCLKVIAPDTVLAKARECLAAP